MLGRLALCALALVYATGAAAQDTPDPHQVFIDGYNFAGSGCPQGSVAANLAVDAKAITLLFDSFSASAETGQLAQVGCQVNINMRAPLGWSFALFNVDYRGYVEVNGAAVARQQSRYSFAGSSVRALGTYTVNTPTATDYQYRNTIPLQSVVWSSCDGSARLLTLATDVSVDARSGGSGLMTVDSIDGELVQKYGITWQRCPSANPNQPFVIGLYMDTLGRFPTQPEVDYWLSYMTSHNRQQTAAGFFYSAEKRRWEVGGAYRRYLGRTAGTPEIDYWVGRCTSGLSSDELIVNFVASDEFYRRFGNTPQGFVTGLYRTVLQREPDAGGLNYWVSVLPSLGRVGIARGFVQSGEFRNAFVRSVYTRYLQRQGEASGVAYWVNVMNNRPADAQEAVLSMILASDEYWAIQNRRP